jgi:hypothetical protein
MNTACRKRILCQVIDIIAIVNNNPAVQTLGLSDPTIRTENRLKSLFWPSIQTGDDVDYLGMQGFWVCIIVAALSLVLSIFAGHEIIGAVVLLFFFLGGVGVREHSRYAASVVLLLYVVDTVASGPSMLRLGIAAVLFSNLRATWIASRWNPESTEATSPPRLRETWSDKFSDTMPTWLWPKARYFFYIFSIGFLALEAVGVAMILRRHA